MKEQRKLGKAWWISFALIAVLAVIAIWIFVEPAKKDNPVVADPTTTASTSAPVSGCNVPAGDTSNKPAIPKDLKWKAANGLSWPVSDTYGPTQTKNGFGSCFAHSPLGAALAASTIIYAPFDGHSTKETYQFYAVDSPGKTSALANGQPPANAETMKSLGLTPAGFSVLEYTPDRAAIGFVMNAPNEQNKFISMTMTMVWEQESNDWKIKLLDDGSVGGTSKPVAGQFVTWGGSNG